jgi:hypothetical protein
MILKQIAPILVCPLILAGCASTPVERVPSATVSDMSTRIRDDFKKINGVMGPKVTIPKRGGVSMDQWQLSAEWHDDGATTNFFITFRIVSGRIDGGWAFLKEAYDNDGTRFPVTEVSSRAEGALTWELCDAKLSRGYLESAASSPKQFRLYGRRQIDVQIATNVVQGFLAKLESEGK